MNKLELVCIASYQTERDALILLGQLAEADIPATIQNYYSNKIYGSMVDLGGYRVEVMSDHLEQVRALVDNKTIILPDLNESTPAKINNAVNKLPFPSNWNQTKRLRFMLIAIACLIAILSFVGLLFANNQFNL